MLVCAGASPALATTFDEAGNHAYDAGAAWTFGFEEGEWEPPPPPDGGDPPRFRIEEDEGALEGSRVLKLDFFGSIGVPAALPAEAASYRVTAWAKDAVIASVEVEYDGRRVDDFGILYPTGRMTSDGWYELSTGAFAVGTSRLREVLVGFLTPTRTGAAVDAIEIVPEGDARVGGACRGIGDKAACASDHVCMWGRCRNMTSRVPPLPPQAWRDDLVSYLDGRFNYLYGPFKNRALDLPNARAEIEGMRAASDAWTFWHRYRNSIHRLHDWHTSSSSIEGFIVENPRPISLCFIEGSADVSHAAAPQDPDYLDVLIYEVGTVNTLGLSKGDRLVAVDGRHPIEWARSLITVDSGYHTASNHETHGEFARSMNSLLARFADRIEVVRCDSAAGTCASATETISVSDLEYSPPGTRADVGCDNRVARHVPGPAMSGVRSGIVKESDETEAIYGLDWNSLNVQGTGGGVEGQLRAAVAEWRASARGVILDHRTGNGGTNLGPPILWDFVREPVELDVFLFRQHSADDGPASLSEGKAIFDELAAGGFVEVAGSTNPVTDVPVALLITVDGSASDWLPLGMKGAPKARIFGPYETAGAFSTLFNFSYWSGLGYSIAVGDTIFRDGDTLNGVGVEPDVVVVPLQSDLLADRDTVYDAALDWVRAELKP